MSKFRMRIWMGINLLLVPFSCFSHNAISSEQKKADLIIFSFDRPLQLYALLESVDRYVSGLEVITVIYRSSSNAYAWSYQEVLGDFPYVQHTMQGSNPAQDFKPLVLKAMKSSSSKYVLYAVDDIIVTDYIDVTQAIELLEQTNAYGFYFRMGKNITYDYNRNRSLVMPQFQPVIPGICSWVFSLQRFDAWNYPHTVDMALYAKQKIEQDWTRLDFSSPNTLEARWHSRLAGKAKNRVGLCYEHSKIINVPLNRVQEEFKNKNMQLWSATELLDFFNQGLKIDIKLLYQYSNRSVHMDYEPQFITR